jgi:hypothetical protein
MSGKCSTGHLSRLLNVLQGYDTNLNVKVTIDIKDEVYAKIKHLIEKNMMEQENMDDIMEDMLSDDKTIYINFVKNVINDNIFEIIKEYENVNIKDIGDNNGQNSVNKNVIIETIIECLDKYTGTKDKFSYLK